MTTAINVDDTIDYDFEEETSFLRAKYLEKEPIIDGDLANDIIRKRREVTGNKPHRLLIHAVSMDGFNVEAKMNLFGPQGLDGICSIAILYGPDTEEIAKSMERTETHIPIKAFPAKEIKAAEDWSLAQPIH